MISFTPVYLSPSNLGHEMTAYFLSTAAHVLLASSHSITPFLCRFVKYISVKLCLILPVVLPFKFLQIPIVIYIIHC